MTTVSNASNQKLKVLVIEDDPSIQKAYCRALGDIALLFPVADLATAWKTLEVAAEEQKVIGLPIYDFVIVDACILRRPGERVDDIPDTTPNTIPLVEVFRRILRSTFIAASSDDSFNKQLVEAGCGYVSNKTDLREVILQIVA